MQTKIFFILLFAFASCKGRHKTAKTKEPETPFFITQKIEEYKKDPNIKHWPLITRYTYKGKFVYYFKMPCCDQLNVLYDGDGNELCKPDGGFTGKGDGKCNDFDELKKDPLLIWPQAKQD